MGLWRQVPLLLERMNDAAADLNRQAIAPQESVSMSQIPCQIFV